MNESVADDPRDVHGGTDAFDDLDGHTLEELSDYLDAGRMPRNPSIDGSPGCQIALDALESLRSLTPELVDADAAAEPPADEGWVQSVLAGIRLDARPGRRIPIPTDAVHADLGITEGAVRGLIRAAEHAVPGVLVGRSVLDGDVTQPGAPVRARAEVTVRYGEPIPPLVERLRQEITDRLRTHTDLNITGVDIVVQDVQAPADARRSPDEHR